MKTQRTTRHLLTVALCTLALGSPAWAGGGFFDDFSDGSIQDASPVTWWNGSNEVSARGTCLVTAEGLEFTPDWPANYRAGMYRNAGDAYGRVVHYTGNLTIRTQVKIGEATTEHGSSVCLWFRGKEGKGYLLGINNIFLWFLRSDYPNPSYAPMDTWHYRMNGSFDPKKEFILRADVIDLTDTAGHRTTSRLEARWWVVGQAMPVQPQLTVYDATYEAGEIAIGADCDSELNRTTIFRWVEVIGTEVEAEPIVDFNGDGTVGSSDLLRLIESWGQDDPAVDLDRNGVVDQKDLKVLMDHWQQDVNEAALLAHWALDETQGTIASDSTGLYDARLFGSPAWDPEGGRTGGALRLDGLDDCAVAPFVGNPAEGGAFSVLAWVKGGAPGQVLISQAGGMNWLRAAQTDGCLMTEAKVAVAGRTSYNLCSQVIITDGEWHRVGLVRDGVAKSLYVDDVVVAEDMQTRLAGCLGGVLIGCGSNKAPGTYWKGLIDDVRIYTRAVRP